MKDKQTEKERILLGIIAELYSSMLRGPARCSDDDRARFAFSGATISKGDLVLCQTTCYQAHPWALAYVEEVREHGSALLREIGTGRLCNMGNEGFSKLEGVRGRVLWTDQQVQFESHVFKAMRKFDEDWHRYGGIAFDGDAATVTIREKWGGMELPCGSKPYQVVVNDWKHATIKRIVGLLEEAGFGTRKFDAVNPIEEVYRVGMAVDFHGKPHRVVDPLGHWFTRFTEIKRGNPAGTITICPTMPFHEHKESWILVNEVTLIPGTKSSDCLWNACTPDSLCWECFEKSH